MGRLMGLEPTKMPESQSGALTNFATDAISSLLYYCNINES